MPLSGADIALAAIDRWLAVLGIRTLAEWDILVFLDRHGFSLLDSKQIVQRAGHNAAEVGAALRRLQELGLIRRLRFSEARDMFRRLVPIEQNREHAFTHLMSLADNRAVRLALRKRLGQRSAAPQRHTRHGFPVVAFGGSAGGLGALREIFGHLSVDTGMAFVVVQHMSPYSVSFLPELLSHATAMPVQPIEDGMRIRRDQIFVIPPNTDLTIKSEVLHLAPRTLDRFGRHRSIDRFFTSLAKERATSAISVILSGMNSDGVMGTAAIKMGGGTTVAQRLDTALQQELPRDVLADGWVDFAETPTGIAELLDRLSRAQSGHSAAANPEAGI